jgi:hypothetical protein
VTFFKLKGAASEDVAPFFDIGVGVGCFFLFSGPCLSGCGEFLLVVMNSGPVRLGFMRIQGL